MNYNQKKHNPNCKLIEKTICENGKFVNLVYSISNEGKNEGLEAYYRHTSNKVEHFYRSYRWIQIPKKYKEMFELLKSHLTNVKDGHKLTLQ